MKESGNYEYIASSGPAFRSVRTRGGVQLHGCLFRLVPCSVLDSTDLRAPSLASRCLFPSFLPRTVITRNEWGRMAMVVEKRYLTEDAKGREFGPCHNAQKWGECSLRSRREMLYMS